MRKLILLLMLICSIGMSVSAEENLSTENYDFLTNIGLINDESISFDDLSEPMTRAEFVSIAMRLATKKNNTVADAFYQDVPGDYWAAEAIYTAASMEIVSKADSFNPEGIVTLEQADKIAVTVLGYKDIAEAGGGWASGYLNKANDLELNEGVLSNGELTKYDALCILKNTAIADKAYKVISGSNISYEATENKTPLTELYDIYYAEGVIGENGVIRSDENKDKVAVEDEIYFIGNSNAEHFLGQNVRAYYYDDNDVYTIVYVEPIERKNEVKTIMSEDMISYSNNVFSYYENGRKKSLKTTPSLKVIYNGQRLIAYENKHILINNGETTFIDNDNDGICEVVQVYAYENYYVEAKNSASYTVVDGKSDTTSPRALVLDADKRIVRIYNELGEAVNFEAIPVDSVIMAYESIDKTYVEAYICSATAQLTIKGMTEDGGRRKLITQQYELVLDENYKTKIELGVKYVVFLNSYNHIAYMEPVDSNDIQIGYLYSYNKDSNDEVRRVKILTTDNEYVLLELVEKAMVDDCLLTDENTSMLWDGTRKLIAYTTNKDGMVTKLYNAQSEADVSAEIRIVYEDKDLNGDGALSEIHYDPARRVVIARPEDKPVVYYPTLGREICFDVPMDQTDTGEDDYYIFDLSRSPSPGLAFGSARIYSFKDQVSISVIERMYETKSEGEANWYEAKIGIVQSAEIKLDEYDVAAHTVTTAEGDVMYVDENNDKLPQIHQGDIILYEINPSTKYIKELTKLYCYDTKTPYEVDTGWQGRKAYTGEVKKIEGGNIMVLELSDGTQAYFKINGSIYSMTDGNKPVPAAGTDIFVGSKVAVTIAYATSEYILILE